MKYYLNNKTKEKPFLFMQSIEQNTENVNMSLRKM